MTINVDGLWGFYAVMGFLLLILLIFTLPTIIDNFKPYPKKSKHVRRK
jgi:hypothetical protein